jgi:hypothetical protein
MNNTLILNRNIIHRQHYNFEGTAVNNHLLNHQERPNYTSIIAPPYCPFCFTPSSNNSTRFNSFWNWIKGCGALTYNNRTQNFFRLLTDAPTLRIQYFVQQVLRSILYKRNLHSEEQNYLQQALVNILQDTDNFSDSPSETVSEISTESDIEDNIQEIQIEEFTIEEDSSDLESINLEDIEIEIEEPEPIQQEEQLEEMAAAQQDIQALTQVLQQLVQGLPAQNNNMNQLQNQINANTLALNNQLMRGVRIAEIPTFNGGNQDPIAWLEDFTRSCNANGIPDNQKLQVVPAYLKGSASTWWSTNQLLPANDNNRIINWTGNNNIDFDHHFINEFKTQTLLEIWTTEFERRHQRPDESVDSYAAALRELYKRIETNGFAYPEHLKARRFVNGLIPELHINVKPHNDQTWNAALNRAKSYELTYKDQKAVTAYMSKYTASPVNNTTSELQNAIALLTQKITEINTNVNTQSTPRRNWRNNNNYNNNNYNNNNQQRNNQNNTYNRQNLICYSCGQPGHTKRNCPTLNNNTTQPIQNTFQQTNLPPVNNIQQVPIQQIPIQQVPTQSVPSQNNIQVDTLQQLLAQLSINQQSKN